MSDPTFFPDARSSRRWLEAHAASATELLVGYHKVATGRPSLSWSESVDEALCHGWIDGHAHQIRFTPRRPRSIWSAVKLAKVEWLRAERRMTPAGLAAFEQRTEARSVVYAYEQEQVAELSPTERAEFQRHAAAWRCFEGSPPSHRRVVLHGVCSARKAETRRRASPSCWRPVPPGGGCVEVRRYDAALGAPLATTPHPSRPWPRHLIPCPPRFWPRSSGGSRSRRSSCC